MSAASTTRTCPSCGGRMNYGEREETVTYQGHSLTYLQPGWHCDACGDGIVEGADNEVADAALHEVMAAAKHSPIPPLLIRAAREAVGLSQREAGRVFGGGPTAFYKYETAKSVPSEAMSNLLRLALERPDLFHKPGSGERRTPRQGDVVLLRTAAVNDQLSSIIRRVYSGAGSVA
ncbi:HTH-type transcriptional regulator / antitoxin MqsA [Azospirillaceae bacterium]